MKSAIKLTPLVESILREEENKQQVAAMDAAMGDAFKTLGAELEANKEELQQDVAQADVKVNEALGATAVIGMILAAPKVVELLVKGIGKLVAMWKKLVKPKQAVGQEEEFAKNIINFTHKWHKAYIKALKWILKVTGLFKKANIQGDSNQEKAAEVVYYTIIAGLAIYSGIGAFEAFKSAAASGSAGSFSLGALETAMAGIKSGEVVEFLAKVGLKA